MKCSVSLIWIFFQRFWREFSWRKIAICSFIYLEIEQVVTIDLFANRFKWKYWHSCHEYVSLTECFSFFTFTILYPLDCVKLFLDVWNLLTLLIQSKTNSWLADISIHYRLQVNLVASQDGEGGRKHEIHSIARFKGPEGWKVPFRCTTDISTWMFCEDFFYILSRVNIVLRCLKMVITQEPSAYISVLRFWLCK